MYPIVDPATPTVAPHANRPNPTNDNDRAFVIAGEAPGQSLSAAVYNVLSAVVDLATGTVGAIRRSQRRRVSIRELSRLSDRQLTDIGIHRGAIETVVDKLLAADAAGSARTVGRVKRTAGMARTPQAAANSNQPYIAA